MIRAVQNVRTFRRCFEIHWTSVHLAACAERALMPAKPKVTDHSSVASIGFRRAASLLAARRQVSDKGDSMRSGDFYRDMARELLARAGNHPNAQQRAKLETTAAEWLRLADEVDRVDRTDCLTSNFELPARLKTSA